MVVCAGLKGLPKSITTTWESATVQACILHLIRNTLGYGPKRGSDALARDLRPIRTVVKKKDAAARFEEFTETWGQRHPAIMALWRSSCNESIPFLDYDVDLRRIICSTNALESLTAATGVRSVPVGASPPSRRR